MNVKKMSEEQLIAILERRRSGAAGIHKDRRLRRNRSRSDSKRRAIKEASE